MRLQKTSQHWCVLKGDQWATLPGFDLDRWLGEADPVAELQIAVQRTVWRHGSPAGEALLPMGAHQEVWAAGVTYLRSKAARMEESNFSATAYDRVYDAPRPEIFFKANSRRCVGDGQALRLRDDSKWMVPEPELALLISAAGRVVGFTIGDDLSCRDIEGDNLLYLPQAKTWDRCCALGPAILVNDGKIDIRRSSIQLRILRKGDTVFAGETSIDRIKRPFDELVGYLFRNQVFPAGVFLLTGTGIVPPEGFSLLPGDTVVMDVPEIGTLTNTVE